MSDELALGIDCGGTHTDAALLSISSNKAKLLGSAKTRTNHEDLGSSIIAAIELLKKKIPAFPAPASVTLGTTLAINAIVQNRTDKVGLALSSGPGLDPVHFTLGNYFCIVPGGLDHRGMEVAKLYTQEFREMLENWIRAGVTTIACVSKFSPRNPLHEEKMAAVVKETCNLPVVTGHELSGSLNFPRRIATAYYSAAIGHLHRQFLLEVENALKKAGISAPIRLLKADGGAIPLNMSRKEPAQSILSGPAASVMGCLALWPGAMEGCSLLVDIGGTTTDLALFINGSPVVDRNGMPIMGRRTLVKSLAAQSIGIGGDSLISIITGKDNYRVEVGPVRKGPAMAFGGESPTLLDVLNFLDQGDNITDRGDISASIEGINNLAKSHRLSPANLAKEAEKAALAKIAKGAYELIENINSRPIYTLAALREIREARPARACIIGGPARAMQSRIQNALGMPVEISPYADVGNAIGAALTLPTAQLEIYADTGRQELTAPSLNIKMRIPPTFNMEDAKQIASKLLSEHLKAEGLDDISPQITEADMFATLDDYGHGAMDIRVTCQATPGIKARVL